MKHLKKEDSRKGYTTLTAEKGWVIRSKETGMVYKEITITNDDPEQEKLEVIRVPDLKKREIRKGYTTLTAEKGWVIRSKKTGMVYKEITITNNDFRQEMFEVIPVPISARANTGQ